MRDYELEDFLKHYGVPGMKRPSGLKYKTGRINSTLYSNRQRQMTCSNSDSQGSDNGEWHKEKYIRDIDNKIDPSDPSRPRKSDSESTSKPYYKEYKFSKDKRDKFRRARQDKLMTEANIIKVFEKNKERLKRSKSTNDI